AGWPVKRSGDALHARVRARMSVADHASSPSLISSTLPAPGRPRTALLGAGLCALSAGATIDPAATDRPSTSVLGVLCAAGLPLAVLLAGTAQRWAAYRAPLLLFGVPAGVALGSLARPAVPMEPIVFVALVATLLAYVASAARWLAQPEEATRTTPR